MATTTTGYTVPYNYNIDPNPTSGSGSPYGAVPGNIGIPPNIYEQLGAINPELANQTGTANQNIMSELRGELSPETLAALQNNAAQFGAKSGMPGSQFQGYYGLSGLKDTIEGRQRQGEEDYLAMLKGVGATLTPQQLAADIASRNATMRAAPDPLAAANQQMQDWQNKFNQTAGGTRINPGGGTGAPASIMPTSQGFQGPYGATGPFTNPTQPNNAPVNVTGNTVGGGADNWSDIGGGYYMNLATGEIYDSQGGQQYSGWDETGTTGTENGPAWGGLDLTSPDMFGIGGSYDFTGGGAGEDPYSFDYSGSYDPYAGTEYAGSYDPYYGVDTSWGSYYDTGNSYDYSQDFSPDTGGYYYDYSGEG
jgi:hypothetical protein